MKLTDLYRTLSFGPLSNLSIGMQGKGTIEEDKKGKIISYINEGLMRLYSAFILREGEVHIQMIEGVTNYHLLSRFSQSACEHDSRDPVYILDEHNPFCEDVIKVLTVNYGMDDPLPLNDVNRVDSVFTPYPTMVQVPNPIDGETLSITYQAQHVPLEYGVDDQDIRIPATLTEALSCYVAHKVYSHMNGAENSAKAQEYLGLFTSILTEVTEKDLVNTSVSTSNSKFKERGWV